MMALSRSRQYTTASVYTNCSRTNLRTQCEMETVLYVFTQMEKYVYHRQAVVFTHMRSNLRHALIIIACILSSIMRIR